MPAYPTMEAAIDAIEQQQKKTEQAVKTPSKSRSFSDPPTAHLNSTPALLAPSPTFHEKLERSSKDDHALPSTPLRPPRSPRRPEIARGLSLQMPSMPSPSHFPLQPRGSQPLSPQLDQHQIYMHASSQQASPATSLPRHSRGLDWSRACTNLHHSTLAPQEQGSPDASPVISQKGVMIPGQGFGRSRKGSVSSVMMLDSPNLGAAQAGLWGSLGQERGVLSSSVGSVNMLASESESEASDDDDASMGGGEEEDAVFTTPHVHKLQNPHTAATPFGKAPSTPGGGNAWGSGAHFSPAQASLMKTIRRARLGKNSRRSRKSSSSASGSGYSSMASPRTTSPPPLRSIESAANGGNGYFQWTAAARSRRESLALGTDGLHLSSGNDSGDEASTRNSPATPGVVRRTVTARRGNLLPKTKGFARVRAALMEESAPVDSEVRREAETIRQVRERDGSGADDVFTDGSGSRPQTANTQSSPSLLPAVPEAISEDFGKDLDDGEPTLTNGKIGLGMNLNFATHATRNSGGMDYWHRFDPSQNRTPPPSFPRNSSSGLMSDITMDSEASQNTPLWRRPRAASSVSDASEALAINTGSSQAAGGTTTGPAGGLSDDVHLNRFKRRRDDDFDIGTIKRRAVSPGMSAQNSPVLTHSPTQKDMNNSSSSSTAGWGQPPEKKSQSGSQPPSASSEVSQSSQLPPPPPLSLAGSRHGSGGSTMSIASTGGTLTPNVSNGTNGSNAGFATGAGTGTGSAPGSSGGGAPGKKLGLQGMVDTNDGLMKMSIE